MIVSGRDKRLFEVGCGYGSVASAITSRGWAVTGIDPSEQGIAYAMRHTRVLTCLKVLHTMTSPQSLGESLPR